MIELAIASASATLFLNYIIGKPGSEFSPYEIFSSYTVFLAKNRLKEMNLLETYNKQYNNGIIGTNSRAEVISLKNDFKKMLYNAAEPYFTWERAVGMCSVCTCFWVSLIIGILVVNNISGIIENIVISHIIIRLLNKFL